jgi:hypothetical protein
MDEDYNPNPSSPDKFSNLDSSSDEDIERDDLEVVDKKNRERFISDAEYLKSRKMAKKYDQKPATRGA